MVEKLTAYIREKYQTEPERPWKKYPENRTFKAADSDKWFALIMPVENRKLGIPGEGETFVVNVKSEPGLIGLLTNTPGFLPGYHMNKQHWLTIFLDGTVPEEQVYQLVDESYGRIAVSPTKRIYEAVKRIPRGKVATYGMVAEMAGDKKMARAVGNALHRNPDPDTIPCYRVVNSKGELSGEFAFGGSGAQQKLLEADGIRVENGRVDLRVYAMDIHA